MRFAKQSLFLLSIAILIAVVYWYMRQATQKSGLNVSEQTLSQQQQQEAKKEGYTGTLLAGSKAPYLAFIKTDYEKAKREGKIIFLDFYANWCPICRAEAPEIQVGFDSLLTDNVVGFRVNYNDSETDDDEKALAKEFGVTYQHTKVILKDRQQVLKDGDQWDRQRFAKELAKIQ